MGKVIKVIALLGMSFVSLAAQQAIYPDAVIADHQVGLFTNRQAWPPQLLQTTLTPTATSIVVGSSAGLVTPTVVQIRDEIIKVSSESAGTITVWSMGPLTVSVCNNTTPISVTTSTAHNLTGAERVTISGTDVSACNLTNAAITRTGPSTFTLDGTIASGITSVTGTLSATGRGYDGTTATTHLAGSTVTSNVIAAQLTQMFREIKALETAGPATGGVAGIPPEIQLNIGGSHGVFPRFSYSGEFLTIPRSITDPATKGGTIVLEEPTGGVGGGIAALFMDVDTVTGFRVYHYYDADFRMGYFNFFANRRLNVEYDGDIIHHNDRSLFWKDSSAVEVPMMKLDTSNHMNIGPQTALPGTPDILFYKDGVLAAKISTDAGNGEVSFIPGTDQDRQVGAFDNLWQRIIGKDLYAGRTSFGAEVQGNIFLGSGISSWSNYAQLQGTRYIDPVIFTPVSAIQSYGGFLPGSDNTYLLGMSGRRWKQAHITDLFVNSCTGCGAAGHPVVDTTAIVVDDGNASRLLKFELGGFTGTNVLTPQNNSYTLAGTNISNTFTANQNYSAHMLFSANNTYDIGTTTNRSRVIYNESNIVTPSIRLEYRSAGATLDYFDFIGGPAIGAFAFRDVSFNTIMQYFNFAGTKYWTYEGIIRPETTSTFALGTTSNRWSELHADKGFFPSGVTAGTTSGSPGCVAGPPSLGYDNGRLYWDDTANSLYICSSGGAPNGAGGTPVLIYP